MLGAIVLLAGLALVDSEAYLIIRFAVSILALVMAVFAWQARQWWWVLPLAAVAVLFNPVVVVSLSGDAQLIAHYVSAIALIAVGILVKVRNPDDRNPRTGKRS